MRNELSRLPGIYKVPPFRLIGSLTPDGFNPAIADSVSNYLDRTGMIFTSSSNYASHRKDQFYNLNAANLNQLRNDYYNYKLEEIVTKYYERKKILFYKNSLVQNTDPIFDDPPKRGFLGFRTHFYAPVKYIFGIKTDTFKFNIILVLLSTVLLFLALYFEILARAVRFVEKFRFRKRLLNRLGL